MANNKLEEFCKSIDKEYGKSNTEKNIDYIMSLVKQREQPDRSIDDNIPAPSLQSTAEVIYIVMTRGDIPFKKFCEKDRGHKQVIEPEKFIEAQKKEAFFFVISTKISTFKC